MLASVKGKFIAAACRYLNLQPGQDLRDDLTQAGWRFRTIDGPGEGVIHEIIHPDGKPLNGEGAPGFISGEDRGAMFPRSIILPEQRKAYEKRWQDFSKACAIVPERAPRV